MIDIRGTFTRSIDIDRRLRELVPGGAHTYAKGRDQYPEGLAPVISHGKGAHVFDVDGNEYIEYGSGLRAVTLGHAHPYVVHAVQAELERGTNFVRPAEIELTAAESFLAAVPTAEMVKFTKNGSDATSSAIRLARAVTGRDLIAMCLDGSFFSTDDWYIGRSVMDAGIPAPVRELTLGFAYGDLAGTEALLQHNDGRIACLILQASAQLEPMPGYLQALLDLAHRYGALLILDEMITGFRWSDAGAQGLYGITPDLSAFGKAMGNGIAVSALAGRREFMELGGLDHGHERVFLLSTTHGAETHALAAAIAVREVYEREAPIERMERLGTRLATGIRTVAAAAGVGDHVLTLGRASNLVFATRDGNGEPSQAYRTLFMRQLILGGVLAPSFVVSAALTDEDIDRTIEVVAGACTVYRDALDAGDPAQWLGGRSVQPVFRRYA